MSKLLLQWLAKLRNLPLPVAVVNMSWAGISLNDRVLIATLVWLSVQIGWFIWLNIIKSRVKQVGWVTGFRFCGECTSLETISEVWLLCSRMTMTLGWGVGLLN